ncbi:thioredoxin-dependent thiol peroxidase [Candidatus Saccharibacteria bacterium]|nr:MAG: thioredoxin-dependent thiol peroxidase [Candidatus Saccharibacteria bacterium]
MKQAPDFSLPDQTGTIKSLKDFSGRWVVLYFYPKDDTPGCTTEACNFRDARESIASLGNADVIGISKDSVKKHARFAEKYQLNFTLLSDPEAETIKAYGAWGHKKFMGREFEGILRNTYLITPDGNIAKEYLGVNPKEHAAEIINDLQALQAENG